MKRRVKIVLILVSSTILIFACLFYLYLHWVIVPINSSSRMLTLVKYGTPRPKRIILRNYVADKLINDYELELKESLHYQLPQSYQLPKLKDGTIEVLVEFYNDGVDSVLKINYKNANVLYKSGLLLYFYTDFFSNTTPDDSFSHGSYVYFISGNERISYGAKSGFSNWVPMINAPSPKRFTRVGMEYAPLFDSNWKEENKWKVVPGN